MIFIDEIDAILERMRKGMQVDYEQCSPEQAVVMERTIYLQVASYAMWYASYGMDKQLEAAKEARKMEAQTNPAATESLKWLKEEEYATGIMQCIKLKKMSHECETLTTFIRHMISDANKCAHEVPSISTWGGEMFEDSSL
ncbi:hypothetical protein PQR75_06605 [Paraburkholderia fungorum]|uniref:hypothetical protein n=1 Tax=Paraburkholderia fungorum TaxID=134537 RepID=UPI0038BBB3BC